MGTGMNAYRMKLEGFRRQLFTFVLFLHTFELRPGMDMKTLDTKSCI
jgi:hypothetical protein